MRDSANTMKKNSVRNKIYLHKKKNTNFIKWNLLPNYSNPQNKIIIIKKIKSNSS